LNVSVAEIAKKNIYGIAFNMSGPITRDPDVRRALAEVINADDIVQRTIGRFAQPAAGIFPPGVLGHDPGRRRMTMTPAAAREILRGAGHERLTITASIHPVLQDRYRAFTNLLIDVWRSIDVDCRIATVTTAEFV